MHYDLCTETALSLVNLMLEYLWLIGNIIASDDFTEMRWLMRLANLSERFPFVRSLKVLY